MIQHIIQNITATNMTGKHLSYQEIKILINKYSNLILLSDNLEDIKIYKYRLLNLKRKLDLRSDDNFLDYTKALDRNSTNIKILCKRFLNHLGFTQNSLYKSESEILCDKLCCYLQWWKDSPQGRGYSNELLATCIVKEILEHYNSKFNEEELYSFYGVSEKELLNLQIICHRWCIANYWKEKPKLHL